MLGEDQRPPVLGSQARLDCLIGEAFILFKDEVLISPGCLGILAIWRHDHIFPVLFFIITCICCSVAAGRLRDNQASRQQQQNSRTAEHASEQADRSAALITKQSQYIFFHHVLVISQGS